MPVQFQMLQMAYEQTSSTQTLVGYLSYLNGGAGLLPGEGARILTSVLDVMGFINDLKDTDEQDNPAEVIFGIIDRVAMQKAAVMNEMVSGSIIMRSLFSCKYSWTYG